MLGTIHPVNIRCDDIMEDVKPRNPADFPVLGVLSLGPAHGYDLCRELRDRLGEIWRLPTSRIYALLARLEKDGLVRHERIDQESRPAKKVFSITYLGRDIFLEWVRSPVTNERDIRLEFLGKLYFAGLDSPAAAAELISAQLSVCRITAKRLKVGRRACKTRTEYAAWDYRLAMVAATAAWLTKLLPLEIRNSGLLPFRRMAPPGLDLAGWFDGTSSGVAGEK